MVALNAADGLEIFSSVSLDGVGAGSPVTSFDGRHIYLTLNSGSKTTGHFAIFDTSLVELDVLLSPIFNEPNDLNPYSPPGVFHNPDEGYYDGGEDNRNDIIIWGFDTAGNVTEVGNGTMFAYQQPLGYEFDGDGLVVLELGGPRAWQASTAPVLTNRGRSMYWSHTKSSARCWDGASGVAQTQFDRGRSGTISLDRGTPPGISARASPALSSDVFAPTVYGPGADAQFFRSDSTFGDVINITTDSLVFSPAKVSPDDLYVYYVTESGFLYQADGISLGQRWLFFLGGRVEGDIAMNSAGTMIYAATTAGLIRAVEVATIGTAAPSQTPSSAPSSVPTSFPTTETDGPTVAPTFVPTGATSFSPTSIPSSLPSMVPSTVPSTAPSTAPSKAPSNASGTASPIISPVVTTQPTVPVTSGAEQVGSIALLSTLVLGCTLAVI